MSENNITKEISADNRQEGSSNNDGRLTFVHELIEIFVGSIALIAPAIILLLWVYRVVVCRYYGLPIFYSSLNIVRFLPVFFVGAGLAIYFWSVGVIELGVLIDVRVDYVSQKDDKKQTANKEHMRTVKKVARLLILASLPCVLIIEFIIIMSGKYPLIYKNGGLYEAAAVLLYASVVIIGFVYFLYQVITQYKELSQNSKKIWFYCTRKWKDMIFRLKFLGNTFITVKHLIGFLVGYFLFSIIAMSAYIAIFSSYFKLSYYLVDFNKTQYAIVLDTDDYYIGEPIDIIQHVDNRELIIHTNSYVYLDKAENPIVVQNETFDSVTVLRK